MRLAILSLIILLAIIAWRLTRPSPPTPSSSTKVNPPPAEQTISTSLETHATAQSTPLQDLQNVQELVTRFSLKNRHLNTLYYSQNADFCEHLMKSAFPIPTDHPSLGKDAEGRTILLDRWGTPYLFHPLSHKLMQMRSAGPDRQPYTQDDLIWPKP